MKCDDEDTTARRGRGDEKIKALIEERKNTDKRRKKSIETDQQKDRTFCQKQ